MKRALHLGCCGLFVAFALELHLVSRLPDGSRGRATILLYLAMTLLMGAVWTLERRHRVRGASWVLAAAVLARIAAFSVPTFLSNDVDRYLWDGAVVLAGCDPYSVAADDPRLLALRAVWTTPVEHLQYPTLYPPLALSLFALCASFGPELAPWIWRAIVFVASTVVVFACHRLLGRFKRREHLALVALSPLLLIEGQVGGHLDVLVAAALALGLLALYEKRPALTALCWGLGAALKLLPLGVIAVWLVGRGLRRSAGLGALAASVFLAPYLWALAQGWVPVGSLSVFFEKWRFGSPLWFGLEASLAELMPWVALGGAALSALLALGLAWRAFTTSLFIYAMAIPLVWSPVVFPWYLVGFIPLLLVRRSVFLLLWLATMPLTYEILDRFDVDASWTPAAWPVVLVAAAWGIGLAFDMRSGAEPGVPLPETLTRERADSFL